MMLAFKEQSQLQIVEREEIEDQKNLFECTDKLMAPGINAGDVKKKQDVYILIMFNLDVMAHVINAGDVKNLQVFWIYTCDGLMMHAEMSLTRIKGHSEAKVDKTCEAVEKIVNFAYITGSDALLKRKTVVGIRTGSQALDELLGGGIKISAIKEAFGELISSGKTQQLPHTLCLSTQLPINKKGGNGKVAYIDTEGTFSRAGEEMQYLVGILRAAADNDSALQNMFEVLAGGLCSMPMVYIFSFAAGIRILDEVLRGGIETSAITEAFGELIRSGKTQQLVHTLCVSTQIVDPHVHDEHDPQDADYDSDDQYVHQEPGQPDDGDDDDDPDGKEYDYYVPGEDDDYDDDGRYIGDDREDGEDEEDDDDGNRADDEAEDGEDEEEEEEEEEEEDGEDEEGEQGAWNPVPLQPPPPPPPPPTPTPPKRARDGGAAGGENKKPKVK